MATARNRIIEFDHHFAKAQATEIIELDWGFAHLQRDFPLSHAHNRIVVTGVASGAEVVAVADEILGGACLAHRHVWFDDFATGQAALPELRAAGYDHEPLVVMVHDGSDPGAANHEVREISVGQIRPALVRDWLVEIPEATSDEIDQLADRVSLYSRAAETTFLAVFDGDQIGARAELYVDRDRGIAQFESLVTHPDFRRRGYGGSLVREAIQRSSAAGCDLLYLTAADDDWPKDWYARLGYVESHHVHEFSRF